MLPSAAVSMCLPTTGGKALFCGHTASWPLFMRPPTSHAATPLSTEKGFKWNLPQIFATWVGNAEKVFKVRGQRSRSCGYKCVNAVTVETYILTVWCRKSVVFITAPYTLQCTEIQRGSTYSNQALKFLNISPDSTQAAVTRFTFSSTKTCANDATKSRCSPKHEVSNKVFPFQDLSRTHPRLLSQFPHFPWQLSNSPTLSGFSDKNKQHNKWMKITAFNMLKVFFLILAPRVTLHITSVSNDRPTVTPLLLLQILCLLPGVKV